MTEPHPQAESEPSGPVISLVSTPYSSRVFSVLIYVFFLNFSFGSLCRILELEGILDAFWSNSFTLHWELLA